MSNRNHKLRKLAIIHELEWSGIWITLILKNYTNF